MISITLGVESYSWSAEDIERVLGRRPDRTRSRGVPHPPFKRPSKISAWYLSLPVDEDYPGGADLGISASIVGLGDQLAIRLGELPGGECTTTLSIVQKVFGEDDTDALGIHLRVDAMQWLVTARAAIDIDQYFYVEAEESAGT